MESFSSYIKAIRIRCGYSVREMAAELKISSTYYADVEKGRRYPMDMEKLMLFGQVTGMSREELHKLLDLAGKARGTVAPDVAAYIVSNPCVSVALRTARDVQAERSDWESFTDMLVRKYGQPSLEV